MPQIRSSNKKDIHTHNKPTANPTPLGKYRKFKMKNPNKGETKNVSNLFGYIPSQRKASVNADVKHADFPLYG